MHQLQMAGDAACQIQLATYKGEHIVQAAGLVKIQKFHQNRHEQAHYLSVSKGKCGIVTSRCFGNGVYTRSCTRHFKAHVFFSLICPLKFLIYYCVCLNTMCACGYVHTQCMCLHQRTILRCHFYPPTFSSPPWIKLMLLIFPGKHFTY